MDIPQMPSTAFFVVTLCVVAVHLGLGVFGVEQEFSFSKEYPPLVGLLRFITGTASIILVGLYVYKWLSAMPYQVG